MRKLEEMVAFGDAREELREDKTANDLRVLRGALRAMLAISLLGLAFSGVMTYREYTAPAGEVVCAPLGPGVAARGLPPCVYGLALYAVLVAIAALALGRTRGGVGDEIIRTP